jgi:hypothetical protein
MDRTSRTSLKTEVWWLLAVLAFWLVGGFLIAVATGVVDLVFLDGLQAP